MSLRNLASVGIAALTFVVLYGCGGNTPSQPPADDHTGHEMPETFATAVAELKEHAAEIKEAFEAGKPEDAHDALHFVGDVSEVMTGLIDSSDLTPEQKTEAKAASDSLFDQYMRLDEEVLHKGTQDLKYADVGSDIDEALAKLESLVPAGEEHEHDAEEKP